MYGMYVDYCAVLAFPEHKLSANRKRGQKFVMTTIGLILFVGGCSLVTATYSNFVIAISVSDGESKPFCCLDDDTKVHSSISQRVQILKGL